MKNRINTTTILLVALLLFGCKKEKNDDPVITPEPTPTTDGQKGKVATYNNGEFIDTYYYDSQGRAISLKRDGKLSATASYNTSYYKVVEYDSEGNPVDSVVYPLNAQGYIASSGNETYTYDTEGHVIKIERPSSKTENTFNNEGDKVKYVDTYNSADGTSIYTFNVSYLPTLNSIDFGDSFIWGKDSKHLMSEEIVHWVKYNAIGEEVDSYTQTSNTYTYEFDSKGRVSKCTQNQNEGGVFHSYVTTYTYYE